MRANTRKENLGFVFQSFNLIDELTVAENIELPLLYLGMPSAERRKRVDESLEYMGIKHREKHFPQQLSGGQQQRVAVARAVISNPNIILADEPTGNLDSANGNEVMDLLTELNKNGTTIVMVTQMRIWLMFVKLIVKKTFLFVLTESGTVQRFRQWKKCAMA